MSAPLARAAITGFLLFTFITVLVFCLPYSDMIYARAVLAWPGFIVHKLLGFDYKYISGFGRTLVYLGIVNGLIGGLLFGVVTFSRLRSKGDHEG